MPPISPALQALFDSTTIMYPYGMGNTRCGYCEVTIGNKSYTLLAGHDGAENHLGITPLDYRDLLHRGWRRSGNILYKPDLKNSCCQEYTIRLNGEKFKPKREQRKAMNAWASYIIGKDYRDEQVRKYPVPREEKKRKRREGYSTVEAVHQPEYSYLKQKNPLEPAHKLEIVLEENTCTEEKFQLYKHYQMTIHKEKPHEVTKAGFKRFLCTSPFKPRYSVDEQGRKIGAYHQCYYLDGKLVAIAVLDLLPDCVSGVYFIYHEDIGKFSPGKLSAVREGAMAKELGYMYYYMGYYIHTCPKMRYKCEYEPSEVLDPEYYEWVPFDKKFRLLLDERPYLSVIKEEKMQKGEVEAGNYFSGPRPMDDEGTVFTTEFSGVPKLEDIEPELSNVTIVLGDQIAKAMMLMTWEEQDANDTETTKHRLAEVVATAGTEIVERMMVCIAFKRH